MPQYKDLAIYTSLLRHAAMGINAASTVSLELLMQDKSVVNLGFDPPGSQLPPAYRWIRHINFDHYKPVAESGAVNVARSTEDMRRMILKGLERPETKRVSRRQFIQHVFDGTLDGRAGTRIARGLLSLAEDK
jgi:hypothetical protein